MEDIFNTRKSNSFFKSDQSIDVEHRGIAFELQLLSTIKIWWQIFLKSCYTVYPWTQILNQNILLKLNAFDKVKYSDFLNLTKFIIKTKQIRRAILEFLKNSCDLSELKSFHSAILRRKISKISVENSMLRVGNFGH